MKRIETLTPEQTARFPEFVEEWTKIGLCTDPADRPRAEKAIAAMYRAGGKAPPQRILWCGSPAGNALTRAIVLGAGKKTSVWTSVWTSVGDNVRDSVWTSVRASVGDSVWDNVRDSVWTSVRASVGDSVWDSVGTSVWASVRDSVGDNVGDNVRDSVYGQHDAGWLAFYDFFRRVCDLKRITEPLAGLSELARSAGWAIPHERICWVSERHCVLHRDANGRLHKDGGPALSYPDGWSIYALHGVRFKDPKWVETRAEELDPKAVVAIENAEQRREMIRKIGIERMLVALESRRLDRRGTYELLSVNLGGEVTDARYLKMLNPSIGVWHIEGVDPKCKTVQEALNWRASCDADEQWKPEILT